MTQPNYAALHYLAESAVWRTDRYYTYEDYRMTVTLYDIETQEAIDSAWDVLCKKVCR